MAFGFLKEVPLLDFFLGVSFSFPEVVPVARLFPFCRVVFLGFESNLSVLVLVFLTGKVKESEKICVLAGFTPLNQGRGNTDTPCQPHQWKRDARFDGQRTYSKCQSSPAGGQGLSGESTWESCVNAPIKPAGCSQMLLNPKLV